MIQSHRQSVADGGDVPVGFCGGYDAGRVLQVHGGHEKFLLEGGDKVLAGYCGWSSCKLWLGDLAKNLPLNWLGNVDLQGILGNQYVAGGGVV